MCPGWLHQTCTPVLALTSLRCVTVGKSLSVTMMLFLTGKIRNEDPLQLLSDFEGR